MPAAASQHLIEFIPLSRAPRLIISKEPPPPPAPVGTPADREWQSLCAANPRLYSGPILASLALDPDRAELTCRRDTYQRLAIQPRVPTGVRLCATTAILIAHDSVATPHALLGLRHASTRIYGNMWELGPSGGIDPPHESIRELLPDDLLRSLADEVSEESGITLPSDTTASFLGLLRDRAAHSDDLVFVLNLGPLQPLLARRGNWEYADSRWLPLASLFEFARTHPVIPPTQALIDLPFWSNLPLLH